MTKTIFCDIDGTLLYHTGDIVENSKNARILPDVLETMKLWDKLNYKIILVTGRKESTRQSTEKQLFDMGIVYDQLIMGLPNGDRILINDRKPNSPKNTAFSFNLVRNFGLCNVDIQSKNTTISDRFLYDKVEKPWGSEELVECNDRYVVKKLFMKAGNSCSLQYHELKTETIIVLSGEMVIAIDDNRKLYKQGECVTILPYQHHRMEAATDCVYIESSTNELYDVVRLEDSYGRV